MSKLEVWKKAKERISVLLLIYTLGLLLGVILYLLRIFKRIEVKHLERFPRWTEKRVIISNHPSYLETLLLPALFFFEYFIHPIKFSPWSTPKAKYYKKWFFILFRPRSICVEEGSEEAGKQALMKMIRVLRRGSSIVFFPEGRRTKKITDTDEDNKDIIQRKGKMIRELRPGIASLVKVKGAIVVFVWVDGAEKVMPSGSYFPKFRKKVTIKIGEPMKFKKAPREKIMSIITDTLLDLGVE